MSKTLILIFHRNLAESKANAALAQAASRLPGVEIVDVQAEYPDGSIDLFTHGGIEAARLLSAGRIVFQFPIQWYSTPAVMKAWQDAVLTRMFYVNYADEGRHLEGTPLLIAATAGNVPEAYRPGGANAFTIAEILTPLRATAHRCGLPLAEPFLVFQADKLSPEALELAGRRYAETLKAWIAATPADAPLALEA